MSHSCRVPAVPSGFYQRWRSADVRSPLAPGPTLLATSVAFGVGYAFMKFIATRSCLPFVAHRIALALLVLALPSGGIRRTEQL